MTEDLARADLPDPPPDHAPPPAPIDLSDIPDTPPGTRLGTLQDALDRARARRPANAAAPPPSPRSR